MVRDREGQVTQEQRSKGRGPGPISSHSGEALKGGDTVKFALNPELGVYTEALRQSFILLQRGVRASPDLIKQNQLAYCRLLTHWGFSSSPHPHPGPYFPSLLLFLTNPSMSGSKKINIKIKITYERCLAQCMTHRRCWMYVNSFPLPLGSDRTSWQSQKGVAFWLENPGCKTSC